MNQEYMDLAGALVIIGCMYFIITKGINFWILLILFIIVGIWGARSNSQTHNKLIDAQIKVLDSQARLNNSNALAATTNALSVQEQLSWMKKKDQR